MKKSFMLLPALALMAWNSPSFAGVRLSQFLAPGSGYYAQVILGDAAIQPISLKLNGIGFFGQNRCGLTITTSGDSAQISGTPDAESCVLLFRGRHPVDNSAVDLPVELYKLPAAPAPDEWPALLAQLPKLPPADEQLNEIFITDEMPATHADFNASQAFRKAFKLHAPGTSDGKPDLFEVLATREHLDSHSPKPYKSCQFAEASSRVDYPGEPLDDMFIKIGLTKDKLGDATIEACKVSALGTWPGDAQPLDLINIYVVKSYL